MISEIRIHSGHEKHREGSLPVTRRPLPLMCPHCQQPIQLAMGLCGNRQVDAILLQAERIGTELECHRCGLRFVFHRTRSGGIPPLDVPEDGSVELPHPIHHESRATGEQRRSILES